MKSPTCTDGLIRAAGETEIRSPVLWLVTDGEGMLLSSRLSSDGTCQGNPGPGGRAARLTRDDRPSHSLQRAGSDVNTTTTRLERMVVSGG